MTYVARAQNKLWNYPHTSKGSIISQGGYFLNIPWDIYFITVEKRNIIIPSGSSMANTVFISKKNFCSHVAQVIQFSVNCVQVRLCKHYTV